ncbi:NUDIX hydrolase [Macrococcus brunensis]|uniref:NUDIX hydrolase n=1 Tax=Macrococcus brunensis TaxID=198483 RepID=UPI001EF13667|nr:NUDIX hydrolase [Macrococcus brunensis]ULG72375.1 NUDIX hydrolase [Macrococcus brunensis]
MEIWDAYDKNLNCLGTTLTRGEPIPQHQYHIVVEVTLRHRDGSFLAMQRDWSKRGGPGLFEITAGGSLLQGEAIEAGAIRELQEETGITVRELEPLYKLTVDANQTHYFGYIAETDAPKDSIVLQETETIDYRWITPDKLADFITSDKVVNATKERVWSQIKGLL